MIAVRCSGSLPFLLVAVADVNIERGWEMELAEGNADRAACLALTGLQITRAPAVNLLVGKKDLLPTAMLRLPKAMRKLDGRALLIHHGLHSTTRWTRAIQKSEFAVHKYFRVACKYPRSGQA